MTSKSFADLDERDAILAARLVYTALPDLYDILPGGTEIDLLIVSAMRNSTGEIGCGEAWFDADSLTGVVCSFPIVELRQRQLADTLDTMRTIAPGELRAYQSKLAQHASRIEPVPEGAEGSYLARIAVDPVRRGSGTADLLLESFFRQPGPHHLHVSSSNQRAIRFYEKHGFRSATLAPGFRLMIRA